MENAPFYILLTSIIFLLTASLIFPAYGDWRRGIDQVKALEETKRVVSAIESVSTLGDVGSTEQLRLHIPGGYRLGVENHSINLSRGNQLVKRYPMNPLELRYHGAHEPTGPGVIELTVTHWTRGENFSGKKDYLIEVLL